MPKDEPIYNEGQYNDAFYEWERSVYGDNPCDYVLSDDDRILWISGYRKGIEDFILQRLIKGGK